MEVTEKKKNNDIGFGNPVVPDLNIVFIGDGSVSDAVRLRLPAQQLIETNDIHGTFINLATFKTVEQLIETGVEQLVSARIAVLTRPAVPELLRDLKEKFGHKIIADVDDDFHAIPISHPGYKAVGPGNVDFLEKHRVCLYMADKIVTTTPHLKERLTQDPFTAEPDKIAVIPNGWGDSDWWGKKYQRDTVNIGWGGTITHRADFLLCRDALVEITMKYKWAKIVIAGDPEIYKMLDNVKEEQKMFLPMVRYEDYPHTLMYYDILLAPLENTPFNRAKSDIKLVDAGAAKIPFVASDVPIYAKEEWLEGGLFARNKEQWFNALENLLLYDEYRKDLGEVNRDTAKQRHMDVLAKEWLEVYKGV